MRIWKKLFGDAAKPRKDASLADSGQVSTSADQELRERDNVGTRCETESRGNAYFATLLQKDPEPIAFYFFDSKERATEALSEVSCIAVAKDSGQLVSTEILTFGVFPAVDGDGSRTWSALLAGKSLTHDLWSETRECFKRHGGRVRREDEPPKGDTSAANKRWIHTSDKACVVTFVQEIDLAKQGGVGTKKIYEAPDKQSALEFLKSQDTSRPFFYIEIKVPSGWVGKDQDGVYEASGMSDTVINPQPSHDKPEVQKKSLLATIRLILKCRRYTNELSNIAYRTFHESGGMVMFSKEEARVKEIGRVIHTLGGFSLMQYVHYRVEKRVLRKHRLVIYHLDGCWDGIGEWRR